jgi:hypothetical protein
MKKIKIILTMAMILSLLIGFNVAIFAADELSVSDGYGLPGSIENPLTIILENDAIVKGLYFELKDTEDLLTISGASVFDEDLVIDEEELDYNFRVDFEDEGEFAEFVMIPKVVSATLISIGTRTILDLLVDVDAEAPLGTTVNLTFLVAQVLDNNNNAVAFATVPGQFWIGTKGDVTADGRVDLFDVLRMVDITLARPPVPTPYEEWSGDFDDDGDIDIIDINHAIDIVLGNPLLLTSTHPNTKFEPTGLVSLSLSTPQIMPSGDIEVPLTMTNSRPVTGLQMSMKFDAKSYRFISPKITRMGEHMRLATRIIGDEIRLIVYSTDGQSIRAGEGVLMTFPLEAVLDHENESVMSLDEAISATEGCLQLKTLINKDQVISNIIPRAFALWPNSPNPFNAGTAITYEIPQSKNEATSVQLLIYNVHGQLVRTLVSDKQAHGRYTVNWDGKDNSGRSVSTGVYIYRLRTDQIILDRKMALLK